MDNERARGIHVTVFDTEDGRKPAFPGFIGGGDPAERERELAAGPERTGALGKVYPAFAVTGGIR